MKPVSILTEIDNLTAAEATLSFQDRQVSIPCAVSSLRIDAATLPKGFHKFDTRGTDDTASDDEIKAVIEKHRDMLDEFSRTNYGRSVDDLAAAYFNDGDDLATENLEEVLRQADFELYPFTETAKEHVLVDHSQTVICKRSLKDLRHDLGMDAFHLEDIEPAVTFDLCDPKGEGENIINELKLYKSSL